VVLDREHAQTAAGIDREPAAEERKRVGGALGELALLGGVGPAVAGETDACPRDVVRLRASARVDGALPAFIVAVDDLHRDEPTGAIAHRDGVVAERQGAAEGGARLARGHRAGDLRLLVRPRALALELGDDVHRTERSAEIVGHRFEQLVPVGERVRRLRPLHAQHAEDLAPFMKGHADGLTGLGIRAAEALIVNAAAQHHRLAARRDVTSDAFADALWAAGRGVGREADRGSEAQLIALHDHDRCGTGAHPPRDLLRRASQERARVACVRELVADPREHLQPLLEPRALTKGLGERSTFERAHLEQARTADRGRGVDRIEADLLP
jgi:hypothetical protein